jgi:ParB-like nuclease domain
MQEAVKLPAAATLDDLKTHELAALMPPMGEDEYNGLVDSIQRQGLLVPITIYEGKILDGRHRYRAAKEVKYKFSARDFVQLAPGIDPEQFVLSTNGPRRNLTRDQKKELVITLLKKKPNESDREIGRLACVDNKTVASIRENVKKQADEFLKSWALFSDAEKSAFVIANAEELRRRLAG